MKQLLGLKKNVYIILICILVFGIITQIARSNVMLKYASYDSNYIVERLDKVSSSPTISDYEVKERGGDFHCLLYDSEDQISLDYLANFKEVYRYIKQHYLLQDITIKQPDYTGCHATVILADLERLPNQMENLETYIYKGGHLFLARISAPGINFREIYRKLGVVQYRYLIANTDIELKSNILIGNKNEKFSDHYFYNDSLMVELDTRVDELAVGTTMSLIWSTSYGDGNIIVYNGNNLYLKSNRGLIAGAISMLVPNYIYPIFNSKLFYIDDYPAPMSTEKKEIITNEYNRNIASFYRTIWWPDMIAASKKYNIKYTAVAILDYNEIVEAPFPRYRAEDLKNTTAYGREVLKLDGEIGIHGYNHQPLQFDQSIANALDYKIWTSYDDMAQSIREVVSYMDKAFPRYIPVTYVPPSNVLGKEGRQALVENWDTLKVIASLYGEDMLNRAYIQEFEVAPDGVIEMPRATSGYADSTPTRWLEANVLTLHGYISHFIHPDDIFDDNRSNGKKWSELYKDFKAMLERMDQTYPWLRAQTSGEAAIQVAAVLNSQMMRSYHSNKVSVQLDNIVEPQYYIMRTNKKIGKLDNCTVELIDDGTYLVKATEASFNVELR